VPCGPHQQVGERLSVPAPNRVKIMADSEHYVKVPARKRLQFPPLKPQLRFRHSALWTTTMLAGVGHENPVISIGAFINVIALLRRPASHDVPRRPALPFSLPVLGPVGFVVITKYLLYNPCFHP
jgi:hypothetical protein